MTRVLALVVPCYNEEQRLRREEFVDFLEANPSARLVFVDDGSTDNTRLLLEEIRSSKVDQVSVVELGDNRGKGEAVRTGLLHALHLEPRPELVGYWDADLAAPLHQVPMLASLLDSQALALGAFGVRLPGPSRSIHRTASRRVLGRVYARLGALTVGESLADVQCGAKLFRVDSVVVECLGRPFDSRWAFDVELLLRMKQRTGPLSDKAVEVPLSEWRDVPGSNLKPRERLRAVAELSRLAWRRLRKLS